MFIRKHVCRKLSVSFLDFSGVFQKSLHEILRAYAPVIEPTLSAGTQALVVAALTYLAE